MREAPDGGLAVTLGDDTAITADLIVVGTGAAPDDALAKAAGLAAQDGIVVDDHGRTSDPAILAAGDCTRFPGPHGPGDRLVAPRRIRRRAGSRKLDRSDGRGGPPDRGRDCH